MARDGTHTCFSSPVVWPILRSCSNRLCLTVSRVCSPLRARNTLFALPGLLPVSGAACSDTCTLSRLVRTAKGPTSSGRPLQPSHCMSPHLAAYAPC